MDPFFVNIHLHVLVESYLAIAYGKLLNFQDAEDITQEVFIKAYQKLNNLKHYDRFVVWLHSITNNLCKNLIRSRSRRPDRDFIEDQEPLVLDVPSIESYKDDLVNELIHDALNSLPEIYRQVLSLHYLGGMKDTEIAEFLGMSHTNVRQRLMKARTLLKEEMLVMMNATFEGQKLQAGFTFRIVEMVKHIKIQPVTQMKGLPWGLSLATGLIITFLSLNPYIPQLTQIGILSGSPLPSEMKVLKVGEIPVDVVKTSDIAMLSNRIGKGKGGEPKQPDMQNAFMAPKAEGGEWKQKADMPTARQNICSDVVNGKIYVIGGYNPNTKVMLQTVEEYDPATDKWAKKADMPTLRMNLAVSSVNGKIYAIGGMLINGTTFPTIEEYDPIADKWIKKTDMPTARFALSTGVVNGKIYAIGGCQAWGAPLSIVEEYDPIADKWTRKADMPTARYLLATATVNEKIYAIGGCPGQGLVPTVEEYDPITDSWIKKADMPNIRFMGGISVVNGKIYIIGGVPWDWTTIALSLVEEYDPIVDKWSKKADIPTARTACSSNTVGEKIYTIGGMNEVNGSWIIYPTVEEYTPEDWLFTVSSRGKLPSKWGLMKQKE